jgi:hypothetical protein
VSKISDIQRAVGVEPDGIWGPKSQVALDAVLHADHGVIEPPNAWHHGKASSFADPKDIAAFEHCKREGKSDQECFKVGDNGVGCWGDDTKEGSGPCCAVPGRRMTDRWGSRDAAKHKMIEVTIGDKSLVLPVKDRQSDDLSSGAIIDLNPDAGAYFGLKPPFLVSCAWRWAAV